MINLIVIFFLLVVVYLMIFHYKVPWLPIWQKDLVRLEKLIKLEKGRIFYDLGCGNGKVIFYLAKKYPQVKFVGFELSIIFYLISRIRKFFGNYKNVKIKFRDYMRLDFNKADYIYVFANDEPMQEIGQKINKEVNKKIILISYCFKINEWKDYLVIKSKPDDKSNAIYIYEYQKDPHRHSERL